MKRTDCVGCTLQKSISKGKPLGLDIGKKPKVLFIGSHQEEGTTLDIDGNDSFAFLYALLKDIGFSQDEVGFTTITRCMIPHGTEEANIRKTIKKCGKLHIEEIIDQSEANIIVFLGEDATIPFPKVILSECKANKLTKSYRSIVPDRVYFYLEDPEKVLQQASTEDYALLDEFKRTLSNVKMSVDIGIVKKPVKYTLIDTLEKVMEVYKILKSKDVLATDIETTGLNSFLKSAKTITIAFSWEEQQGICIPLYHPETPFTEEELRVIVEMLKDILEDETILKILHNGKYDVGYVRETLGIFTKNFKFDTMLANYILDEAGGRSRGKHSLKRLALIHTDLGDYDNALHTFMANNGYKNCGYEVVPLAMLWGYNCCDTDATIRLYNMFKELLVEKQKEYIFEHIMNTSRAFIEIERNGFKIDMKLLAKLEEDMPKQIQKLEDKFFRFSEVIATQKKLQEIENKKCLKNDKERMSKRRAKEKETGKKNNRVFKPKTPKMISFNPNSVDHMRTLLFDGLKLQNVLPMASIKEYLTGKGKELIGEENWEEIEAVPENFLSTGAKTLEFLDELHAHDVVKILLDFRKLRKLYTTYVKPVRTEWLSEDGLVHSTNKLHGTSSGRIASEKPNMQNIPRGSVIKNLFVSRWEGGLFAQFDYSQVELRVAAMLSKDPFLLAAYMKGEDIHKRTASLIYDKHINDVTKQERHNAKTINFGILYGMGAWALAADLGMSVEEAQEFIDKYFDTFPTLKDWIEVCKRDFIKTERSVSMFGRVRSFEGLKNLNRLKNRRSKEQNKKYYKSLREAGNHIIQSTAADFTLHSCPILQDYLISEGFKSVIFGTVYDSIMIDIYPGEVEEIVKITKMIMESIPELLGLDWVIIPLVVDAEIGRSWGTLRGIAYDDNGYKFKDKDKLYNMVSSMKEKSDIEKLSDTVFDMRDKQFYKFDIKTLEYSVC